jgi:hypothetical protein
MGEKGNLFDTSQEIFTNLAEQGPQFWLNYEQYKLTRAQSQEQAPVPAQASDSAQAPEPAQAHDPDSQPSSQPAAG